MRELTRYYMRTGIGTPRKVGQTPVPEIVEAAIKVASGRSYGEEAFNNATALGDLLNQVSSDVPQPFTHAAYELGTAIGRELKPNPQTRKNNRTRYASTTDANADPKELDYSESPRN